MSYKVLFKLTSVKIPILIASIAFPVERRLKNSRLQVFHTKFFLHKRSKTEIGQNSCTSDHSRNIISAIFLSDSEHNSMRSQLVKLISLFCVINSGWVSMVHYSCATLDWHVVAEGRSQGIALGNGEWMEHHHDVNGNKSRKKFPLFSTQENILRKDLERVCAWVMSLGWGKVLQSCGSNQVGTKTWKHHL